MLQEQDYLVLIKMGPILTETVSTTVTPAIKGQAVGQRLGIIVYRGGMVAISPYLNYSTTVLAGLLLLF